MCTLTVIKPKYLFWDLCSCNMLLLPLKFIKLSL